MPDFCYVYLYFTIMCGASQGSGQLRCTEIFGEKRIYDTAFPGRNSDLHFFGQDFSFKSHSTPRNGQWDMEVVDRLRRNFDASVLSNSEILKLSLALFPSFLKVLADVWSINKLSLII